MIDDGGEESRSQGTMPAARRRAAHAWAAAVACCLLIGACSRGPSPTDGPPTYVGAGSCVACHETASEIWRGSQHSRAMQEATDATVLGDFDGAAFTHAGVTSTFFRRDGKFLVRTDGPKGDLQEFEIRYAFGIAPLQQYLVAFPGGRLQALGIAWDSRKEEQGGQRWFHLYPDQTPRPGDPLHWTGIEQNWNHQCADCHSTNLRKNYDERTDSFSTTWSEIVVSCEACHGPSSHHVAWAQKQGDWRDLEATKGLTAQLDERRGVTWNVPENGTTAFRSRHRDSSREIEVCARCHARRAQFSDDHVAGQPFHDGFRPSLVTPPLYHPDGQQRDEVYDYGSFLQSRMNRMGVTCSDCHEPHGGRLRVPGNGVCCQCHLPSAYDVPGHHHHPAGTTGASCPACHMPTTTYMVVDPRHDHSFRVPRPERSAGLGAPDACTSCHADRPAAWITDAMRRWYPEPRPDTLTFGAALLAGETGAPGAQERLLDVVRDPERAPIVRASALARLFRYPSHAILYQAAESLADLDPNVRMAAVSVIAGADVEARLRHLPRMLDDGSRVVRMDAARALAIAGESRLPEDARPAFRRALAEYVAAQRFNGDRPEAAANLAGLAADLGRPEDAIAANRRAIAIDPTFVQAAVNLADLQRVLNREGEAEKTLRASLAANPGSAIVLHALGLSLVRQRKLGEALDAFAEAARRDPDVPRFAFVHGVALHDLGRPDEALAALAEALKRHPFDRDILGALAAFEAEAGRAKEASSHLQLLRDLDPESAGSR